MNHEQLLEKLGNVQLNMSPALTDLMQRVREVGLHKIAARMHNIPEFNIKAAAQLLGTKLVHQHFKYSKIASGIRALQALDQSGEITLEKTAMPPLPAAAMRGGGGFSKAMLEAGSGGRLFSPSMMQGAGGTAGRGASEAGQAMQEAIALSGKRIPPPVPPPRPTEAAQLIGEMPALMQGRKPPAPLGRTVMASVDFTKMANLFMAMRPLLSASL